MADVLMSDTQLEPRHPGACEICASANTAAFYAREMMFGTGDRFRYRRCRDCGHLALTDLVSDWSRYYPPNYYSFATAEQPSATGSIRMRLKQAWRRRVAKHLATRDFGLRTLYQRLGREPTWPSIAIAGTGLDAAILDVGCGDGALLNHLAGFGFSRLVGIDAFVGRDILYPNGVTVLYGDLNALEEKLSANPRPMRSRFDLVMFHHSFEHVADPLATLCAAAAHLDEAGRILIRIPVASSYAFDRYKENWVQLDAPRHVNLFTEKSLQLLCRRAGLDIVRSFYDSTAFQFWGSEQYEKGVPLRSPRSFGENPGASLFDQQQIAAFQKRAVALNRDGRGDQAGFIILKANRASNTA